MTSPDMNESFTLRVAECAAALMDMDDDLRDRLYDTRRDHDGFPGMWTACAYLAVEAETEFGPEWLEYEFVETMDALPEFLVQWSEANGALETAEQAREVIQSFIHHQS